MKWGPPESPSCHWTTALSNHRYEILLGLVFFAHLFLAHRLPPAEDELYYWTWSQKLSLSYFDHPPMTAWWIYWSTLLFGNTLSAIRLPAVLTHLFLLYKLGQLSPNKTVITLLLLTPLSLFGAILMTPDIPLCLFWFLYMNWATQVNIRLQNQISFPLSTWFLGGLWLGLGLLSKYTMGLAPICLFLLLATQFRISRWVKGFLLQGLVASAIFLPVLIFNIRFDFSPILFQWVHTHQSVPFSFVFNFLGSQILLLGALPFLLIPWILFQYRSWTRLAAFRAQACFFLIPLVFFLYKATHHFLEANWGLIAYLSFWPLASFFVSNYSRRILVSSALCVGFIGPLIVSLLITIHIFRPLGWIQTHQDRLAKLSAQNYLVERLANEHSELKTLPVFLTNYQWTSYFRFHGFAFANQIPNSGRLSHFSLIASTPCANQRVLLFNQTGEKIPQALECFRSQHLIATIPMVVRGQSSSSWELLELTDNETQK